MGLLPEWFNKGERPMGSLGQYTQSNMFTNPTYEQQGKAGRLAQALMQPQQSQPQMQMGINPMQPQPMNMQQPNMMGSAPNQMTTNWNSQYGSY